ALFLAQFARRRAGPSVRPLSAKEKPGTRETAIIVRRWRTKSADNRDRRLSELQDRFRRRLFGRIVHRSTGESALRAPKLAETAVELFRLHLLVFRSRGVGRRKNREY